MIGSYSNGIGWPRTGQQAQEGKFYPGFTLRRIAGVDLGQSHDPSAACELRQRVYDAEFMGPRDERVFVKPRVWRLGTDYTELERDLLDYDVDVMFVEYNNVGRPVVQHLRQAAKARGWRGQIRPWVTAASNVRVKTVFEETGFHVVVPKPALISSIGLVREQWGFVFADCPESHMLLEQMRNFRYTITRSGNTQMGNVPGAGKHDDLVIALGGACFWLVNYGNRKLRVLA